MADSSEKKPKVLSLSEAGQLQRKVFLALTKLRLLQQDAIAKDEQETVQLTTELIENTRMYAMFLEEYMTPGLNNTARQDPDAPALINQIRDHCRIVDSACREKAVAGPVTESSNAADNANADNSTQTGD